MTNTSGTLCAAAMVVTLNLQKAVISKQEPKINADHIFTEDILFSSPSAATAFVGGASLSGNELGKTSDGISLKNLD